MPDVGHDLIRKSCGHDQSTSASRSSLTGRPGLCPDHSGVSTPTPVHPPDNVEQIIGTLRFIEAERITWSLAWVVMPDHLHWLMQLRQRTLPACMQLFKSRSARLLNRALSRSGPIWQRGFYDHAVRSDESLHAQALYIVANPVRAGLATRLGEYPYAWCRWPLDG